MCADSSVGYFMEVLVTGRWQPGVPLQNNYIGHGDLSFCHTSLTPSPTAKPQDISEQPDTAHRHSNDEQTDVWREVRCDSLFMARLQYSPTIPPQNADNPNRRLTENPFRKSFNRNRTGGFHLQLQISPLSQ